MSPITQTLTNLHPQQAITTTTTTTILTTLSAASTTLPQLKQIHAHIIHFNLNNYNSLLLKKLLSSSSLSSPLTLRYALSVFSAIPTPHPHQSNQFFRQLSRSDQPYNTLLFYEKIRNNGLGLDRFTFPPLLKAASRVSGLLEGMEIHGVAVKLGFDTDPFVQTGLVGLYSSCRRIMDARLVFDKMSNKDLVSWSIMIDGYCQNGLFEDVLELFDEMMSSNVEPDDIILSTILFACGRTGNLSYGKKIHELIIAETKTEVDPRLKNALIIMYATCGCMDSAEKLFSNMFHKNLVVSTSMISGYSRVGNLESARSVFDKTKEKDLICWSAMISGYAESDQPREAIELFKKLLVSEIEPDQITMLSVISACAQLGALEKAKWIHMYVDKNHFGRVLPVNNALIDMYAKCGTLERSRDVFENMPRKNVISWTTMINAFAMHGDAISAIKLFHEMKHENIEPNSVTFVGVLYACSHARLVDEGKKVFSSMIYEHKITPAYEHYGCMVDLLGRANMLRDAYNVIQTMHLVPNVVVWGSLMSACRVHGDNELGEFCAKRVLELDPDHDGALVVLSNVYARENRWQDVGEVRGLMKRKGVFKEKGYSRIELKDELHEFLMADTRHKRADEIYEKLDEVVCKLKRAGYDPDTRVVLTDLEEEEKKEVVLLHSEKLAVCYGLLSGEKDLCIRIFKNLRVCDDCHTFMKLVSKVFERKIIVRDRSRFHHYEDGVCSCGDMW